MRRFGLNAAFPRRAQQICPRHRVPGSVPRGVRGVSGPGPENRGVRSKRSALGQKCCIGVPSACPMAFAVKGLRWTRKCCIDTSNSTESKASDLLTCISSAGRERAFRARSALRGSTFGPDRPPKSAFREARSGTVFSGRSVQKSRSGKCVPGAFRNARSVICVPAPH